MYRFLLWMLPILAICLIACEDKERKLGIGGRLYSVEDQSAWECLYVTDAEGNLTAKISCGKMKAEFFRG